MNDPVYGRGSLLQLPLCPSSLASVAVFMHILLIRLLLSHLVSPALRILHFYHSPMNSIIAKFPWALQAGPRL